MIIKVILAIFTMNFKINFNKKVKVKEVYKIEIEEKNLFFIVFLDQ